MIILDREYKIVRDPHCWILSRTYTPEGTNPKTGEPLKEKTIQTYHGNIKQALEAYVNEAVADGQPASCKEILDSLQKIETLIKNLKV